MIRILGLGLTVISFPLDKGLKCPGPNVWICHQSDMRSSVRFHVSCTWVTMAHQVSEADTGIPLSPGVTQAFEPYPSTSFSSRTVSWRQPGGDGALMAISVRHFHLLPTVLSPSHISFCLVVSLRATHLVSLRASHPRRSPLLLFLLINFRRWIWI